MSEDTVNVRYMVDDVAEAIRFYTDHLGFVGLLSRWWPSERQPASAQGG